MALACLRASICPAWSNHHLRARVAAILVGAALAVGTVTAAAQDSGSPGAEQRTSGSMGPVCWAAIVEALHDIGSKCFADVDPEVVAALAKSREEMGEHFLEQGWTDEGLTRFRQQMGSQGSVEDG